MVAIAGQPEYVGVMATTTAPGIGKIAVETGTAQIKVGGRFLATPGLRLAGPVASGSAAH